MVKSEISLCVILASKLLLIYNSFRHIFSRMFHTPAILPPTPPTWSSFMCSVTPNSVLRKKVIGVEAMRSVFSSVPFYFYTAHRQRVKHWMFWACCVHGAGHAADCQFCKLSWNIYLESRIMELASLRKIPATLLSNPSKINEEINLFFEAADFTICCLSNGTGLTHEHRDEMLTMLNKC